MWKIGTDTVKSLKNHLPKFFGLSSSACFSPRHFHVFLLLIAYCSCNIPAINSDTDTNLLLTRVDLLELLELRDATKALGAEKDGRLDILLAFGLSTYTARIGIGRPAQYLDVLLNFAGSMPFDAISDVSIVADIACQSRTECQCTDMFNTSATDTFQHNKGIRFGTSFGSGNGIRLDISLQGYFGSDSFQFGNILVLAHNYFIGLAEHISGRLFNRLPFDGILSMGKRSVLMDRVAAEYILLTLFLTENKDGKYGQMRIGRSERDWCSSSTIWTELLPDNTAPHNPNAFKFSLKEMQFSVPGHTFSDVIEQVALLNPNSPFVQGPKKTLDTIASMVNATKLKLGTGGRQIYTIPCNANYSPLLMQNDYIVLSLPKESLKIEFPKALAYLLPAGQCIWAIQELWEPENAGANWVFGRPLLDRYCIVLDPSQQRMAIPERKTSI